MSQQARAARFRQLHAAGRPLIVPNAWDAASARIIERAGAAAIGTTSAGIAWAYGRPDRQRLRRDDMLLAIERIVRAVGLPVTADIESGYGAGSARDTAETVAAVVALGAAGVNLEDSPGRDGASLIAAEEHAERVRAARAAAQAAGGDLVINARTDVYLAKVGAPETRFAEAVRRANLYRAAGADCLFVPGVIDADTIAALAGAIDGPLNILAMPGAPDVAELGRLGVARVSFGGGFARAALAAAEQAARELLEHGTYKGLEPGYGLGDINGLFGND